MSEPEPLGSDDILYRLRREEADRLLELKRARASAYSVSVRDAEWIYYVVRDAATEIERLRTRLRDAGLA